MLFIIGNKNLSVAIESYGAQLNSIKKCGKEKLWQNDDGSWSDRAPIIFPYCGRFTVKVNGKNYGDTLHGFARSREFAVTSQTSNRITFNLISDEDTRKTYPFDFSLSITYSVRATTLYITTEVKNTGDKTLYFTTGGHESYALDCALKNYYIEFEKNERFTRLLHDDDGRLIGKEIVYPESKYLKFSQIPIIKDETLIFKNIKSSSCKLIKNNGETVATSCFKGFKHILFWKNESGKFICIEPWMNLPSTVGTEAEELNRAKGFIKLDPNREKIIKRKIIY